MNIISNLKDIKPEKTAMNIKVMNDYGDDKNVHEKIGLL